jgi:hypothetical protein
MRVIKSPTEPIFYDAYCIADAIVYQQDQETRLQLAIKREGIMSNKVARLSNDMVRLSVLIKDRIAAWESNYSSTGHRWDQYLPDYRNYDRVVGKA